MTKITSEDVLKVSQLARLEISSDQIDIYAKQIEKILDYIGQLEKIDTTNIAPTTRAVEVLNVFREDMVEESIIREEILTLAPNR